MTIEPSTLQERKLKSLRILLWVCFFGVSVPCTLLGVAPLVLFNDANSNPTVRFLNIPLPDFSLPPSWLAFLTLLVSVGIVGGVCLAIYYILKHRFARDSELGRR